MQETPLWARTTPSVAYRVDSRGEPRFDARGPDASLEVPTLRPAPRPAFVRALLTVQRGYRAAAGTLLATGLAAATTFLRGRRLAEIVAAGGQPHLDLPLLLAIAAVACFAAVRLLVHLGRDVRARAGRDAGAPTIDLEVALLLTTLASTFAAALPGGLDGVGAALPLIGIALASTLGSRRTAIVTTAATIGIEVCTRLLGGDASWLAATLPHAGIGVALCLLNAVVLRREIDAIGHRARRRAEREIERMREQARSYRLLDAPAVRVTAPTDAPIAHRDHAARSGVEEIQIAVRFALDLLKRSLGAHTAILLFDSTSRSHLQAAAGDRPRTVLRMSEVVSDAPTIAEGPFGMGDGIFGAVIRRSAPVSLHGLRSGYRVPYYPAPLADGDSTSLVAAPILEDGAVRGVLCVDRLPVRQGDGWVDRPFSAHEEEMVVAAARYVLRAIENERVFGRLERAKAEQDHLYAAVQRLSGALTEAEVIEAGVESARAIASFDLAAITIVHESETGARTHEVRAIAGAADFEGLVGLRFGDNGGLVAQACKSRCALPHRGDHDPGAQVVFTRRHPLRIEIPADPDAIDDAPKIADVRSILVVPLTLRDRVLGTLVLGARRRGAFRDFSSAIASGSPDASSEMSGHGVRTLEVLASHLATSLGSARMFAKLEELATTDGLTGLLNKRVLLELGAQKVRAAARYGKSLSVIQSDIDHFKKINDTYGHDVGDQVIKGLAGILRRLKRGTDYVARFGGEEFVIVCEETESGGAIQLAERVREELQATTFHAAGHGPFHVTCSLGVATFGEVARGGDGTTWEELYKATDDALYASKRTGRNRTTSAKVLKAQGKAG